MNPRLVHLADGMLAEPPRSPYDINFRLGDIPVRIHPGFWLFSLLMGSNIAQSWQPAVIWLISSFGCILVHELGHALAQRSYGLWSQIVLYAGGGLAISTGPRRVSTIGQVAIALAGPAAGFMLAAVTIVGLRLSGEPAQLFFTLPGLIDYDIPRLANIPLTLLIHFSMFMNITWGLVNLLPVYPLDGGQATRALLYRFFPGEALRYSLMSSVVVAIAVVLYGYQRQSYFLMLLFGYLAFLSYQELLRLSGRRGPW